MSNEKIAKLGNGGLNVVYTGIFSGYNGQLRGATGVDI
jgi:hypothetical protein